MIMNNEAHEIMKVVATLAGISGFLSGSVRDYYMHILRKGSIKTDEEIMILAYEVLKEKTTSEV